MDLIIEAVLLWIGLYAANVALYFGLGWTMIRINARHPDRRIQPGRDGMSRARTEIRESLISIAVTATCLTLAILISLEGWGLWPPSQTSVLNAVIMLVVLVVGYDAWFYWSHRLLHWEPLYKFHQWHHRSVAPTVWSSDSQTIVETALIQSFMVVAALIAPVPVAALVLHRIYDHVNGQLGHSGFEYFAGPAARAPSPMVAVTFHDQHHARFTVNYGNYFSLWDRLMGTLAPDYDRDMGARAETKGHPQ